MRRRGNSGRFGRAAGSVLLLGLAALAPACGKDAVYTYVDVDVTVDDATINASRLYLVTSCEFYVMGADEVADGTGLPCRENNVPYHVGTFQWTSQASSGSLQFTVKLFDANLVALGAGTSDPVAVSPGKHLSTSVLVVSTEAETPGPDGGAGSGPDAAASDGADDAMP